MFITKLKIQSENIQCLKIRSQLIQSHYYFSLYTSQEKKKIYKNSTFTKHVQTFFGILKYKRKDHLSNSSLKNVKSHLKHPGLTFYCYKTIDVVSFCQSVVVLLLHSPFSEDSPTKNPFPSYFLVLYHTHLPPKGYFLIYGAIWVGWPQIPNIGSTRVPGILPRAFLYRMWIQDVYLPVLKEICA